MPKLVRDRIPELFGGTVQRLNDSEYRAALREKLQEEVSEYLESGEVLELADVLEVIYALAELDGIGKGQIEHLRYEKENERGAFRERLFWLAE